MLRSRGIERKVWLFFAEGWSPRRGDVVPVYVGYAMQKLTEDAALSSWELFEQMLDEGLISA